ncbi:MAG: DUF1292 domain-containing protein [Candidatus Obscuribacterales bacterium]|nr:DUF1292 domain-containing protein [Candidatus Obscuribacterales bacterium]
MSKAIDNLEEQTITLEGEDGHSYVCRILGLFEYEEKEYALLLNMGESGKEQPSEEEPSTVVMQFVTKDNQAVFRTIEDDQEFERVIAYVRDLATEMDDEGDEEEGA